MYYAKMSIMHYLMQLQVNSLPNNKILDWSKLKAFADDKIMVTEKLKFDSGMVQNIAGKGEYAVSKMLLIQSH